jgi:hypothetical protein
MKEALFNPNAGAFILKPSFFLIAFQCALC